MATTSILRIGPTDNNLSSKILTEALSSFFQQQNQKKDTNESNDVENSTIDKEEESSSRRLVLQNKYFTANVLLKDIISSNDNNNATTKVQEKDGLSKEDGVILVFDALQLNPDRPLFASHGSTTTPTTITSFDSLTSIHEGAERNNTCGDLLRLCVGVTLGEYTPEEIRGMNAEKEYSRRILWCLDRGYEYIEADLSQEGQGKGHDQRDKDGFARIVEAIQGTVWSSAVLGSTKTKDLREDYSSTKIKMEGKATTDTTPNDGNNDQTEIPYKPPNPDDFEQSINDETGESSRVTGTDTATILLNPNDVNNSDMAKLKEDLEADKMFEKMEGLLKEASQIRLASKNGTLSDDERRERAGEAALALVEMMGQFGDDDDDDDDESSDKSTSDISEH